MSLNCFQGPRHRDRAVGTLSLIEGALVNPAALGVEATACSVAGYDGQPRCVRDRRYTPLGLGEQDVGTPEPRWSSPTYTCSTSSSTTITNPATAPLTSAMVVSGSRCSARLQKTARCERLSAPRELPDAPVLPPAVPDRRDRRNSSAVAGRTITSPRGVIDRTLSTSGRCAGRGAAHPPELSGGWRGMRSIEQRPPGDRAPCGRRWPRVRVLLERVRAWSYNAMTIGTRAGWGSRASSCAISSARGRARPAGTTSN